MSQMIVQYVKEGNWNTTEVYEKVVNDINDQWPKWKKEVYNEMFAISAHAQKIEISK